MKRLVVGVNKRKVVTEAFNRKRETKQKNNSKIEQRLLEVILLETNQIQQTDATQLWH